ncbi:acyl-CoA dehydrogenase family protein [Actinocorallia sp. A-T 12471]|uniref:acyl-CoA dehydrogenase family protein n=1 Tax=Actinocorallia sp. A-T 12471 TaxID=3089813 RepID=UPI0029CC906D|nr:acyl-CoA dehydrogenase family protein [Actinocorallia sp. A-T 12471]MDX6741435.1 acyl-CoA dehydrogenase family protein [Actinocorallia sp. A-T 12471]
MRRTLFNEDHEAFRETVRSFADRVLRPNYPKYVEQRSIDREVWKEAGELGILGLEVPEEYGGSGAEDFRFNVVANEEFAKVSMGYASCLGIHADIVAPYLVKLTTEEQRRRWLPRFCTGELWTAIGMTEPSGGSDLAALKTVAVKDGSDWIINGGKTFITNGYSADLVIVAARTDPSKGSKGISLFAVEADMPGFERGRKLHKVGQPESDTAELFFSDVRVPAENMIGEEGKGFISMMKLLPQERIGSAVTNLAHATQVLEETLDYVKTREAFGQPIGKFQHNAFLLAELATKADVTRYYIDACLTNHLTGDMTPVDAAKAKWWSAEIQNQIIDACVQLHGGYGYMTEYHTAQAWTDARVTKIWAGSNEIMKMIISRDLGL